MGVSNIINLFTNVVKQQPYAPAFLFPTSLEKESTTAFLKYSFKQLEQLSDEYAFGLSNLGISYQHRVLMLFRPNIDFIAAAYALLKIGAIPVFIDPGLTINAMLKCIARTEPYALIGIPLAHYLRYLFPTAFKTIKRFILVNDFPVPFCVKMKDIRSHNSGCFNSNPINEDDTAAIAFTSGSTGIPKGVVYTHKMFVTMVHLLQRELKIEQGNIDLPGLYIFALLNPTMGVTTVMPVMDVSKPAKLDPARFINTIETHGVTTSFGSPTIWQKVSDYCLNHQLTLSSIKSIYIAGAAVPPSLLLKLTQIAPSAKVYTPYGATEALPITNIHSSELIPNIIRKTEEGFGFCVGGVVDQHQIKIIQIIDEPIPFWDEQLVLQNGEIGEICIKGDVVTKEYFRDDIHNELAKIQDYQGFWHRMGDMGYLDDEQRVWICGRKDQRVDTIFGRLYPDMCEAIFNQHPLVRRTALVGIGQRGSQIPMLVIELLDNKHPKSKNDKTKIIDEMLALGSAHTQSEKIKHFIFHPSFPVDARHNVKIQREKLAIWSKKHLSNQS